MKILSALTIAGSGVMMLGGCASSSVFSIQEQRRLAPEERASGPGLVVETFRAELGGGTLYYIEKDGLITGGEGEGDPRTGRRLAGAVKKELLKRGLGAGLRITGQVLSEESGNGALRSVFGLGLGGSRLSVRTLVFNARKSRTEPWLIIWTDGGSGREPGAAFSFIPPPLGSFILPLAAGGAAAALLSTAGKGTGQDAARTAKVVADTIEWGQRLSGDKAASPKLRGAVRVPGGHPVAFTREGRLLSTPPTIYIGEGG